jgi:hypothetical protein
MFFLTELSTDGAPSTFCYVKAVDWQLVDVAILLSSGREDSERASRQVVLARAVVVLGVGGK